MNIDHSRHRSDKVIYNLIRINTELKNRAIKDNLTTEQGRFVSNEVAQQVLQKMAKQRRESVEAYKLANRLELVEKECLDLEVIESYLPKALSDSELEELIKLVIQEKNAKSKSDIGKVMGDCIKKASGRADGKRIQKIASLLLA